jgi:hypothetical protein
LVEVFHQVKVFSTVLPPVMAAAGVPGSSMAPV